MEVLAREKAERDKASLQERIQELEEELQQRRNTEITSHNGSNSRNHVSPWPEEHVDEAPHAQPFEDDGFVDINENSDHCDEGDDFRSPPASPVQHASFLAVQRAAALSAHVAAQRAPAPPEQPAAALSTRAAVLSTQRAGASAMQRAAALSVLPDAALSAQRAAALSMQPAAALSMQPAAALSTQLAAAPSVQRAQASSMRSVVGRSIDLHREYSATSPMKNVAPSKNNKAPRVSPDDLVGKEVTLYALCHSEVVAKATVISTNPRNTLGGQPLGRLYCEVVVKVVIKRDTVLPRPYGDIETLADARSMPIQWPYNRLKISKPSHSFKSTEGRPPASS